MGKVGCDIWEKWVRWAKPNTFEGHPAACETPSTEAQQSTREQSEQDPEPDERLSGRRDRRWKARWRWRRRRWRWRRRAVLANQVELVGDQTRAHYPRVSARAFIRHLLHLAGETGGAVAVL